MAKKRKTRRLKVLHDARQKRTTPVKEEVSATTQRSVMEKSSTVHTAMPTTHTGSNIISTALYEYLPKDLTKTAFLTGAIVVAELILFLVSKR